MTRWAGLDIGLDLVTSGMTGPPDQLGGADISSCAPAVTAFGALLSVFLSYTSRPTVTAATRHPDKCRWRI